ncbi:hypothetical protein GCM10027187_40280 [Streptosporangium sandarakinum]|uniref:IrrE N-terminal-like domain-containing protein n=1 Tax=Streptosporangium sandarakinum TaxID=1260955 RepID=A0A852VE36_9ACTN|nr:hypothetical protein [Streptosporangium sandarakinum]NYF44641.1 hypothetical protein [Streptosporangium sandarakinum]
MHSSRLLAALEQAPIPHPFTLGEFMARIRAVRQRPLHLHDLPIEATSAVSGLWFATRKADHLFVAPGASGVLRVNIVLHEISHMLLDHGRVGGDAEEVLRRLLGPVSPGGGPTNVAARSRYDTIEERDAEKLATLILLRAHTPPEDGDEGLRKLSRTFGYDLGS